MTNPRGQAAIDARRKWRAAHPECKSRGSTKEQRKARYEQVTAIDPKYREEAREVLAGTKENAR